MKKVSLKNKSLLPIKGIQKTTLVDYPGKIATTIFFAGCNFKCPYCHNVALVKDPDSLPTIPDEEVLAYLESRRKYIDGVCITGGEPTLYKDLPKFLSELKKIGYSVKLDTNGTNPRMLKELIDSRSVDFIALDIKGPKENYAEVAAAQVDMNNIEESISLLKQSGVKYEFRTTVLPRFFKHDDVVKIGQWLQGAEKYCLQQFEKRGGTLDPHMGKETAYSLKELEGMAQGLRKYIKNVEVRGGY